MRTWVRARSRETCGFCGADIPPGAPLLEIRHAARRVRCEACGTTQCGPPPAVLEEFEEPELPVPQPSLGLETHRGPDFVTPKTLARSTTYARFLDRKQRASGSDD